MIFCQYMIMYVNTSCRKIEFKSDKGTEEENERNPSKKTIQIALTKNIETENEK